MKSLINVLFGRHLELRVKIFHVLALTGIIICIPAAIVSVFQALFINTLIITISFICSVILLIYSAKGGKQEICYWGTIISIFLTLFPSMFIFGGGYKSGIIFFFIFAVVYTVYMLSGLKMLLMVLFELVYYSSFCVFAYLHPEKILHLSSEFDLLLDVIICFIIASIALGCTMYVQFRMHQKQQRELEQARIDAEVANKAKSTFLANMSHEIRTPIHVIMSINELIRMENSNPKIKDYGEKVKNACDLLMGLLDNILDMSKIEAGKTTLIIAPYSTRDLTRALELVGKSRCESKHLDFKFIKSSLPTALCGDMIQVQQIAMNLLNNAIKYTEKGCVTLSISCKEASTCDDLILRIVVSDTGIGIDKKSIPSLFETFSRLDQPSHKHIEGTGLGLAIVKELCKLMKGTIKVESKKGYGSTFTVEIPQRSAKEADLPDTKMHSFIAPEGKILVVDDNIENLSVMSELLGRTMLKVDTATSGTEAIEKVKKSSYHVILLDYMMPDMDGEQTLKELFKIKGFSVPVIALTANAVAGTRELLLNAGFSEYITKPIQWGHLGNLLIEYLPKHLVTITKSETPMSQETEALFYELQPLLLKYNIDLRASLIYFDGNIHEYMQTANIFLSHSQKGYGTIADFKDKDDISALVYSVHSLKGRAKNLGLTALGEEAERMEMLCMDQKFDEAKSYIPHLLFLYSQAVTGLELLCTKLYDALCPIQLREGLDNLSDIRRELQRTLDSLQRKPSLEHIEKLLESNPSEKEKALLTQMKNAVYEIKFDKASAIYADYLRGEDSWTLETES